MTSASAYLNQILLIFILNYNICFTAINKYMTKKRKLNKRGLIMKHYSNINKSGYN